MKKGDVVSLVTLTGEFVGKFEDQSPECVVIKDPRMLVHGEEGMGFAHGVCATGKANPDMVKFFVGGMCFVTPSNEQIESAYRQQVSGLII